MSGVFGVVSVRDNRLLGETLPGMAEAMNHLPWYQVEHRWLEPDCLGIGRVGIGTFNKETQPISSEDEEVHLVMSGEFYYQRDARRALEKVNRETRGPADSELALQLYLAVGPDFVHQVEGAFVIAIWDNRSQVLELFNDRFGFKPLYFALGERRFLFAPEIKGIFSDRSFPKKLNYTAAAEFVRFQQVLGNKTFFEGIELLPPSSRLTYDREQDQLRHKRYWDWRDLGDVPFSGDVDEATEEMGRLLCRSVEERLERAARPGFFLTGGLDSRGLVAAAGRRARGLPTLTYGHPESRDMRIAARVARLARTEHHEFPIDDSGWLPGVLALHMALVEGQHTWTNAHAMLVLPRARELFDVSLSGVGGVVLSGFLIPSAMANAPDQQAFVAAMADFYMNRHSWPSLSEYEARQIFSPRAPHDLLGLAFQSLEAELVEYDHPKRELASFFFGMENHDRRLIGSIISYKNSHFENRLPYYDYSLVELSARLPYEWRYRRGMKWRFLQRFAPAFTLIPHDKDLRLPTHSRVLRRLHRLIERNTRAIRRLAGSPPVNRTLHTDFETDLRGPLRPWAESILLDDRTLSRGIFNPATIRSLLARHMSGKEVHTIGKLAPIMTYELMLRRFLD